MGTVELHACYGDGDFELIARDHTIDSATMFLLLSTDATERGIRRELETSGFVACVNPATGTRYIAEVVA